VSLVACAALVVGIASATPVLAQTTYSGRAFAAFVNTPLTGPVFVSDTDELPPSGGSRSNALLDTRDLGVATLDSVLTAEVLAASTSGASGKAESSASLANVVVLPGHQAQVRASFVRAQSEATCGGVQGSTEVADLTFGGQSITVDPFAHNQTFVIPDPLGGPPLATLIVNEQTVTTSGTYQEIRVNALHLFVPGVAEVILSSAKSDINCMVTTQPGPCHDFVTGGGWIAVAGGRANFGFNAGYKGGSTTPDIHLNYIDHGSGRKVKATSITMYVVGMTATSRHLEGGAEVDGTPGYTYVVDVADNGEPGRNDTFSISLSDGYAAAGRLSGGGNIQLHKPCQ
jgi:hypothetical protein